jgi:hypothetical protein
VKEQFIPKPMTYEKRERPLKICRTCRVWSQEFKGICTRQQQGVGQFWVCEEWTAPEQSEEHPGASKTQDQPGSE